MFFVITQKVLLWSAWNCYSRLQSLKVPPWTTFYTILRYEGVKFEKMWHVLLWNAPEVKFRSWPFQVKLYIFRRARTRETLWCQNQLPIFPKSTVIFEKNIFEKYHHFDLDDLRNLNHWPHLKSDEKCYLSSSRDICCFLQICSTYHGFRDINRRLLGLIRPLPSAGGRSALPLTISVTNRRVGKILPAMESPERDLSDEV